MALVLLVIAHLLLLIMMMVKCLCKFDDDNLRQIFLVRLSSYPKVLTKPNKKSPIQAFSQVKVVDNKKSILPLLYYQ